MTLGLSKSLGYLQTALEKATTALAEVFSIYTKALPEDERTALEDEGAAEIEEALDMQRLDVARGGDVEDAALLAALLVLLLRAGRVGAENAADTLTALDIDIDPETVDIEGWASQYAPQQADRINETSRTQIDAALDADLEGAELSAVFDGIFGESRARLIAVTETTAALVAGALLAYEAGKVKRGRFRTSGDDRVCPVCSPLDNKEFDLKEIPQPPLHPGCRCSIEPVG